MKLTKSSRDKEIDNLTSERTISRSVVQQLDDLDVKKTTSINSQQWRRLSKPRVFRYRRWPTRRIAQCFRPAKIISSIPPDYRTELHAITTAVSCSRKSPGRYKSQRLQTRKLSHHGRLIYSGQTKRKMWRVSFRGDEYYSRWRNERSELLALKGFDSPANFDNRSEEIESRNRREIRCSRVDRAKSSVRKSHRVDRESIETIDIRRCYYITDSRDIPLLIASADNAATTILCARKKSDVINPNNRRERLLCAILLREIHSSCSSIRRYAEEALRLLRNSPLNPGRFTLAGISFDGKTNFAGPERPWRRGIPRQPL